MAPSMFPALRYRDAPAAIRWLERAFGFETHMEVPGEDGIVEHAELRLGDGMIMLGSVKDDWLRLSPPGEDGAVTAAIYVAVDDVAAHYEQALAAGAEIAQELQEKSYSSGEYSTRDPEGHLWSFGAYNPLKEG